MRKDHEPGEGVTDREVAQAVTDREVTTAVTVRDTAEGRTARESGEGVKAGESGAGGEGGRGGAEGVIVEGALAALDLETKVRILSGRDMWSLPAVPEIGLRPIVMSDGPVGVRGTRWSADDPAITLPSPTALAATWDPGLARLAGWLLGQEARRKGVDVLLAPTVNLHRSPLGGRHFEAFSEDPLLTGAIAAPYVAGVQEHGVAAVVKHFVANDAETDRLTVDVVVSERALREVYLAPFEAVVAAGVWGVMAAYNKVNGVTMTEHAALQRGVLKGEWGFDGCVVSDWFAARGTEATARGGLDVAMPAAGSPWGERLVAAVRSGAVPPEVVDDQARRVLRLAARVGALTAAHPPAPDHDRPAAPDDRPAAPGDRPPADSRPDGSEGGRPDVIDGERLAREIAVRSFVLASDPGGLLPLDAARLRSVAVIGAPARDPRVLGGGSARVFPPHVVSPLDGLTAALPDDVRITYEIGADPRSTLPPAAGPHWRDLAGAAGIGATFLGHQGETLLSMTLPDGAAIWPDVSDTVDPARVAAIELAARFTPGVDGEHRLAVRCTGRYTLTVGGTVLSGVIEPGTTDLALLSTAPPEHRHHLRLRAGETVEITVHHPIDLHPDQPYVSLTLGHGDPVDGEDALLERAERAAAESEVAIVVVGTTEEVESEGLDRATLALPGRQDELVTRVSAANPRTIVVVNAGSPVELPWAGRVAAVLLAWFPGQEAGHALADVLLGAAEPGGRLPTTWPARAEDCPVLGTTPVGGRLAYTEDVLIGYRAWERAGRRPLYPFGHGLGYTTWAYESLSGEGRKVTVTVRNTGDRAGREVVQVYVTPARAPRRLAGFAAVAAEPGQAVTVTIDLPERAFQRWDGGWRPVAGAYLVEAGHSSADLRLSTRLTLSHPAGRAG
ncbi:beta-glucosidase family protein [Nonomuraea candida]|uniref:beta-glucosidase family protein n=1 Tax=Nonomuraea candida TaxID=359159 RepID=UPI000AF1051D|nr:glycoside hydrolase family 3 C-terminal domain-containing protein [Nonomuraea candida]